MAKRSSSSNHRCSVLLLLAISLSKFAAGFSHATPTLFPNQTVFDGQSLISANKTYELGFSRTSGLYSQKLPHISRTAESYLHDIGYVANWSGGYYTYHLRDSSIISRGVRDFSGQDQRLSGSYFPCHQILSTMNFEELEWNDSSIILKGVRHLSSQGFSFASRDEAARFSCENGYYCGANGLCNNNSCTCLFGFEPTNEELWELGNWAEGCKRELPLNCQDGDRFSRQRIVKLPLFYQNIGSSSVGLEDCKAKCLSNCSCTAYASANGNGTGCRLWFGDLMGLQESSDAVQDIYVRLVPSKDQKTKRIVLILIPVAAAVVILLLCALVCSFRWRKHSVKHEGEEGSDCSLFSFHAIAAATNNFSYSNKLGEGGFGPVYKKVQCNGS